MKFPFFRYLDQLFFNTGYPLVVSPHTYWQHYCALHLERCWQLNPTYYGANYHPKERL